MDKRADQRTERALVAYVRQELSAPAIAIMGYAEIMMEDVGQAGREPFVADLQRPPLEPPLRRPDAQPVEVVACSSSRRVCRRLVGRMAGIGVGGPQHGGRQETPRHKEADGGRAPHPAWPPAHS